MKKKTIIVPVIITNGHFNKGKTLQEIKRMKADTIALAIDKEIGNTFSSPASLSLLKECIDFFRTNGFRVFVWLGESFGHSSAVKKEEYTDKYINRRIIRDGEEKFVYVDKRCPLDEQFIADCQKWIKDVARTNPDLILFDDDFRLSEPWSGLGCCCKYHMKKIFDKTGGLSSSDKFIQYAFTGGQNKYRDVWFEVQKESINYFSAKMREALNEVNENIRMGSCTALDGFGCGYDVFERARILAGKTRPFIRFFGAPYWSGMSIGEVIEIERSEFAWHKEYKDIEIVSEGDTYPRPRYATTPAAYLECFDMALRADNNTDGILKYALDYYADADYESGYVDFAEKNAAIYDIIDKMFCGKTLTGVNPVHGKNAFETAENDGNLQTAIDTMFHFNKSCAKLVSSCSLPTAYNGDGVNIIFGENARKLNDINLNNGNIIDLTAAEIMMSQGVDVGIKKIGVSLSDLGQKGFTDLPMQYFIEEQQYIRLDGWAGQRDLMLKDSAKVQTEYCRYSDQGKKYIGIFSYTNEKGERFTVIPIDAKDAMNKSGYFFDYALKRLLLNNINSMKPLDAFVSGNYPHLYMMTAKDERSLSIAVWNLFADKAENLKIYLNEKYNNATYFNCKGQYSNDIINITSTIYPYEFAGVVLTK